MDLRNIKKAEDLLEQRRLVWDAITELSNGKVVTIGPITISHSAVHSAVKTSLSTALHEKAQQIAEQLKEL